jgi:hypothetical protein
VGRDIDHEDYQIPVDNSVDEPMLNAESRGTMSIPFALEGFIVKALDSPEAGWPGYPDNILPFFVTLEYLDCELRNPPNHSTVFVYFPHVVNVLYHI